REIERAAGLVGMKDVADRVGWSSRQCSVVSGKQYASRPGFSAGGERLTSRPTIHRRLKIRRAMNRSVSVPTTFTQTSTAALYFRYVARVVSGARVCLAIVGKLAQRAGAPRGAAGIPW